MITNPKDELPPFPIAFSAGSEFVTPLKCRSVSGFPEAWAHRLGQVFPVTQEFLSAKGFGIGVYPATTGLTHRFPTVETFLHPQTFFSALSLASTSDRPTLITSQPCVGVDFFLKAVQHCVPFPRRILWGTGGYWMPNSLCQFARKVLSEQGVNFEILQAYGMAEVGHSLFCAIESFPNGLPKFHQVADHFSAKLDSSSTLILTDRIGREFQTGDRAIHADDCWEIIPNQSRLASGVRSELESWSADEWTRRTGYLHATDCGTFIQLREGVQPKQRFEVIHHLFWHRFGGSFTMKPRWCWHSSSDVR